MSTEPVTVKPFWQSPSFWILISTILVAIYESHLLPADSPGYKILGLTVAALTALGLAAKRNSIEATAIKAAAMIEASKSDPTKPPQG